MTGTGAPGLRSPAPLPRRVRKFLRDGTNFNIETIAALLGAGRITLSSAGATPIIPSEETLVFEEDQVFCDGQRLLPQTKPFDVYVLFKPKGVITTSRDPDRRLDLGPWLAQLPPGYFPVGRLDRDTTGALLLANDGDLATAILRPEHKLPKLYWLWLNESLSTDDVRLSAWLEGMPLSQGVARAESVEIKCRTADWTELLVTLREGKNRQIRRMCRQSDFRLLHLHRTSVGPIALSGMRAGELRRLDESELSQLWSSVGGKTQVRQAQLEALHKKAAEQRVLGRPNRRLEAWLQGQHAARIETRECHPA